MFIISLFIRSIFTISFELKPHEEEIFEETLKAGTLYKLQYTEKNYNSVKLLFNNDKGLEVGTWNASYSLIHFKAYDASTYIYTFLFKNESKRTLIVEIIVPDLDNELSQNVISSDKNIQSVFELENKLKNIRTIQTSDYIERMSLYIKKLSVYKWRIRFVMVLEIVFSMAMVYFLHKDTVGLFERRKRV